MGRAEARIENYLKREAERRGAIVYKFTAGVNGVPDRILIAAGHVVFVECKAPGQKPRPIQVHRIREMREHGADVRIIDTREGVDALMEEVDAWQNR